MVHIGLQEGCTAAGVEIACAARHLGVMIPNGPYIIPVEPGV